ncbi:uncharacterized protein A1O5_09924 [Cladophialophora psammophila CBS 110553]|uniref:Major facilitator superfamily (MFS) profile domain-containing protein n=1 Tax=Cladophialophora psammophila CBS 110553 TaxID=1182543 RepID=W9X8G6_9EURO|nr:uncharacterized protein A1O5_09924 [Cladophialophora psammophila CBS 110553]EXJ66729.1 hypothetical protein A1O5_09924 [Cladophialophora psammophila CBS 110553]
MASQTTGNRYLNKHDSPNSIHVADVASTSIVDEAIKPQVDANHIDTGLDAYTQALELDPEHLERLAKRVRRKLDFILLPLMVSIFITAYLKKASLNYANAFSLQEDLGLKGRQYSWTVAIGGLGLMIGSYPASVAVQKLPVGKLISCLLFSWGLFSMVLAAAKNFGTIFTVRSSWAFPSPASARPGSYSPASSGLATNSHCGCIAVGLGSVTNTAIRSWQLIFLVVGSIAVVLSMIGFFFLPSGPGDAKFLTREEKLAAVWRIARNQTGIKHGKVLKYQIYEALRDFRVWCLLVQQFTIGMANGALTGYFSAFLRGFGWSPIESVRYQLPIGAVQLFATIVAGYLASRSRNRTIIIILVLAIFAIVAMVGFSTIPADQKMALTSCTWIVSAYGGAIVLNWAIVAANFAGHTKRATVNGINFVAFWIGNFAGPFVFDLKEAPRYPSATIVLGVMIGVGWVATAATGLWMWNANRRRDAKAAAGDHTYDPWQGNIDGFTDRTDKENKSFRYRY